MIAMPRGIVGHHPGFRTPRSPRSVARRPVAPNSKPSGGSSGDATAPQRGAWRPRFSGGMGISMGKSWHFSDVMDHYFLETTLNYLSFLVNG